MLDNLELDRSVLIFQVSLCTKGYFGTLTKCLDYVGVLKCNMEATVHLFQMLIGIKSVSYWDHPDCSIGVVN